MAKAFCLHAAATLVLAFSVFVALPVRADNPGEAWSRLTPEQQALLAPLQKEWDSLDSERRKRWIGLASRYPTLPPERQQAVQQRIHEWASLTPEQRKQAIERYKRIKQLPPEKHEELHQRWREYQALPEEQRQKLRESHAAPAPGK